MSKKKFNQTKVGLFLSKAAPGILDIAGDVLPDAGLFGLIKNLIKKDPVLSTENKEKALMLLEQDMTEMRQVTKRWERDMKSDSYLSKNTRPMTLIFLTISLVIFILLDSSELIFTIDEAWVDLLKSLLITVYVAYFGSRGVEKFKSISNK